MEFTLKTTLKATAKQVYKSWLSSQGHSKMTGGVAYVSDKIDDTFTTWDGYIQGQNLVLEPHHKIIQSWRSTNFNAHESDSQIEITLTEGDGETELTLTHTNVPESGDHYKEGWDKHYFTPMKAYFEFLK